MCNEGEEGENVQGIKEEIRGELWLRINDADLWGISE
jgi:hypothetical protein